MWSRNGFLFLKWNVYLELEAVMKWGVVDISIHIIKFM